MGMGCGTYLVLQVPGLQVIQKHCLESKWMHELGPVLGQKGAKHMASSQGLPAELGQTPSHRAGLTWGTREVRSARDTATSTPQSRAPWIPPNLETSGSWRMSSRSCSMLMSTAQQGKQQSRRMMMARCRITPTRSRFLLP